MNPEPPTIQPGDIVVYPLDKYQRELLVVAAATKDDESVAMCVMIEHKEPTQRLALSLDAKTMQHVRRLDQPEIDHLKRLHNIRTI